MNNKKFWNWKVPDETKNDEEQERILELYGAIAEEAWFDDDVTPKLFRDELFQGKGPVTVWINSPGGDCIAASQIYTALMDYPGNVTVKIDGLAASAASVIAMAGTQVLMSPTSLLMVHDPSTLAFGDRNDMKAAIKMLDEVKESIINAYQIKTNLPRDEISRLMEAETWMNANKAIELGFADGMLEDEKKSAQAGFSFSSRTSEDSLMKKMVAKYQKKNSGREISTLLNELKFKEAVR